MQILSSGQIRAWDEFTIQHEPIASIDLMERAAATCFQWIVRRYEGKRFSIFCAKGNNGGDGLAIGRMLSANHAVTVYILEFGHLGTEDFQINLARLHQAQVLIKFISTEENIPVPASGEIVIDALFGSGLNRPIEGLTAMLVRTINNAGNEIIAIDIPSGLSADNSSKGNIAILASHTLSFQCYKPAFLIAENELNIGKLHIIDIGLHDDYLNELRSTNILIDEPIARAIIQPRRLFAHKGNFGHALLIAGSYGKIGAAVLAAKACLRSGTGLLTMHLPSCGNYVMQTAVPEAMVDSDADEKINTTVTTPLDKYDCIGIGPGLGTAYQTTSLMQNIVANYRRPLVLDADALNILSTHPEWLNKLPAQSVLTPHPKEFERLFGSSGNDFERIQLAKQKAREHQVIVVLKGHHTFIATPSEKCFFNSTGNAGMATGGTGDVLTGIITSLIAQQYLPENAAVLGVYLHGLAGDLAAKQMSEPSLIASDIIDRLGDAFKYIS
ncbi:MAG: NAD(P)H-hydrate dehydratase [Chitinophagaceae bacterium]|nr:NAD(P)H-hydrate dehydratase [Chitinophagaceae bacterium]